MLRLWTLSGESITCPVEELEDVKALKRLLHDLHQFPPRFRQRILIDGRNLDDSAKLDPSVDATVVLQALQQPSQSEADSLAAAAECGSLSKVEAILQLPQDPDAPDRSGGRPIFIASLHGHIETVRLLLEAKADKDSVDHNGATAPRISNTKACSLRALRRCSRCFLTVFHAHLPTKPLTKPLKP